MGDWLAVLFWPVAPGRYALGIWHDGELVREPVEFPLRGVQHLSAQVLSAAIEAEASFSCDETASFEQARGIVVRELRRQLVERLEYQASLARKGLDS